MLRISIGEIIKQLSTYHPQIELIAYKLDFDREIELKIGDTLVAWFVWKYALVNKPRHKFLTKHFTDSEKKEMYEIVRKWDGEMRM